MILLRRRSMKIKSALAAPRLALGFNEGSGSAVADSSGNGRDFVMNDTTAWIATPSPRSGSAINTSLSTRFAARSTGLGTGGSNIWTAMCWFYRTGSPGSWGQLIWDSGNFWYEMNTAGNIDFNGDVNSPSPVPMTAWTHITISNNNNALKLYINGTSVATGTYSGGGNSANWASTFWKIGAGADGPALGYIKDVRIFDIVLADTDVATLMNTPV